MSSDKKHHSRRRSHDSEDKQKEEVELEVLPDSPSKIVEPAHEEAGPYVKSIFDVRCVVVNTLTVLWFLIFIFSVSCGTLISIVPCSQSS